MPTILITGTRKGLGRGLAEHFLANGWTVTGCSRKESDLEHERYRHLLADVADEEAAVSLVRGATRQMGSLDAVVCNAGVASMNHLLLTPGAALRSVFETNVGGTFTVLREAAKLMRGKGGGRIVTLSSVAVPLALEGEAAYAASKAAVETLTRVAARELGPFGITVNAVGPGPVETDLIRTVPKEKIAALCERLALKRLVTVEEVAHAVDFLVSAEASAITGQTLYLGGP